MSCSDCGSTLPPDAPRDLCPRCLILRGLPSVAGRSTSGPDETAGRGGVLSTLAESIGTVPRVLLRDTRFDETPSPLVQPSSPELPDPADRPARLQLFGEIARGGMGAVLKGRDTDLGRDVAVKVLLESHRDNPDLVRRFVEEAQIGGQLQHPGIVPIYELGAFADRRPYFAMKLVKGRTLAAILAERPDPTHDHPRLLGIFEQVCQTMAYAHARGVIHRDLKPSNIMVGSFGEVQVMDWGLAKVLPQGGAADDEASSPVVEPETVIQTARSGSDTDASRAGSVLGTPQYMAPEQARGEVEDVDERADVFALGSILCEVLTGKPAFVGRTSGEILSKARRGDLADALARLDACVVDAELVAIVRDCLALEPPDRPRAAGAVAASVTAYLIGVQERLRATELDRARAEARAVEQRKRYRVSLALAASVLALVVLGGGGVAWNARRLQHQATQVALLHREAELLRDQARAQPDDPAHWHAALEAVRRVEVAQGVDLAKSIRSPLAVLRDEVRAGLDAAEGDRLLLERLVDIRDAKADDTDGSTTDLAYADAFRSAGIDVDALDPAEIGASIRRRPIAVAAALVATLDDWSFMRIRSRPDPSRLIAATRAADPDPDRDQLRATLLIGDAGVRRDRLGPLVERANIESWGPISLILLGRSLARAGDQAAGVAILERTTVAYPDDIGAHIDLGNLLKASSPPRVEEAIREYTAARALRPESGHELSHALEDQGRGEEALSILRDLVHRRPSHGRDLVCYGTRLKRQGQIVEATAVLDRAIIALRAAIRLKPDSAWTHYHLGRALGEEGKYDETVVAYRKAIELNPDLAEAHNNLGLALSAQGKRDEAVAAYRKAIRLKPDLAEAHTNLGIALSAQGKRDEAVAASRAATLLKPDLAEAHYNLGTALSAQGKHVEAVAAYRKAIRLNPDLAEAHNNLGLALSAQGKHVEAVAAHRAAIVHKPDYAEAHTNLGNALSAQGKRDEAVAAYRAAILHTPDSASAHYNLGNTLSAQGKRDEAVAAYRAAILHTPDYAPAHYNLGNTLSAQGKRDEAVAAYRAAILHQPDHAEAHCNLGFRLKAQGKLDEALAEFRRGHDLGSKRPNWKYPSAQWVRQAERMIALNCRLPMVQSGEDHPADAAESLEFAKLCAIKRLHEVSARFYGDAFAADPALAEDLRVGNRYHAACSAALAGCGRSKDEPPPDEAARVWLRAQALAWLRADLVPRTKPLTAGDVAARRAVEHWKQDHDLAGVREPEALAALPEDERRDWQGFWAEVDDLLTRETPPAAKP